MTQPPENPPQFQPCLQNCYSLLLFESLGETKNSSESVTQSFGKSKIAAKTVTQTQLCVDRNSSYGNYGEELIESYVT